MNNRLLCASLVAACFSFTALAKLPPSPPAPKLATAEILAEVVPRVVSSLTFPKTMRWGSGERSFVRPVRGTYRGFVARCRPL